MSFDKKMSHFRAVRHVALGVFVSAGLHLQAGLIITPSYDSSITSDKSAAALESTILSVISTYQTDFLDPIHVYINFSELTSGLGESDFQLYQYDYSFVRSQLQKDAKSADDAAAVTTLPNTILNPVTGTRQMLIKSANAKALGFSPIADGVSDGTVLFNPQVTNPGTRGTTGDYNLVQVLEHEIDEILGLGSTLGTETSLPLSNQPSPEDLFRYDASGGRSFTTDSTAHSYFSIDGHNNLGEFNNTGSGDYGDWLTGATVAQVQDAVTVAHVDPALGLELRALDVIGYDRNTVPEPASLLLFASGLGVLIAIRRRTKGVAGGPPAPDGNQNGARSE